MIEIIVAMVIVLIVVGIGLPALASSKAASKRVASISRLRQIYVALIGYQESIGGNWTYGTAAEMHMPSIGQYESLFPNDKENEIYVSPCDSPQALIFGTQKIYRSSYMFTLSDTPQFAEYARKNRERTVLVIDPTCDENRHAPQNRTIFHRGLGINMTGQIINKRAKDDPTVIDFYYDY